MMRSTAFFFFLITARGIPLRERRRKVMFLSFFLFHEERVGNVQRVVLSPRRRNDEEIFWQPFPFPLLFFFCLLLCLGDFFSPSSS